uniref:Uncharacterized protein n=1 Tax=viral metagenome TaxID=1070528 RepID=A0A6C0KV76_9ZZZZ
MAAQIAANIARTLVGNNAGQVSSAPATVATAATAPIPEVQKSSSAAAAPASSNLTELGKMQNSLDFNMIYAILAYACIFGIFSLFLISLYDTGKSIYDSIKNTAIFSRDDPNVFTKDAIDYESLNYIGKDPNDEPYDIYVQQSIIKTLLGVVSLGVLLLAVQFSVFFSSKVYKAFKKKDDKEQDITLNIDNIYMGIIIASGVCLIVLSSMYKKYFMKKSQNTVKTVRNELRSCKKFIYENLTTNEDFLDAIENDDIKQIIRTIRKTLNKDNENDCTNVDAVCLNDNEAKKMIFTYSLYSYFKYLIPENSEIYNDVMALFNIDVITNTFAVDPTQFFYYKESFYVANIYPMMKDDIIGTASPVDTTNTNDPQAFLKKTPQGLVYDEGREQLFESNLNNLMQSLNKKLSNINNLPRSRKAISTYIYTYFGFTLFALLIILTISWDKISDRVKPVFIVIKAYFDKLIEKLQAMFRSAKEGQ